MRYFYDCEFHEDGRTIDLISIGIVAQDGREYYAVHAEADWTRASAHPWLPEDVLDHLPGEWVMRHTAGQVRNEWRPDRRHKDVKVREQIADEVSAFIAAGSPNRDDNELWAYYAAYDHVALCQMWGRMVDLPAAVPMFTRDLQQVVAELEENGQEVHRPAQTDEHFALADARWDRALHEVLFPGAW